MKAIQMNYYGGAEVLSYDEVRTPEPPSDEILVRIYAAPVNPVDWKIREGYMQGWLPLQLPLILGSEFAGVVETVGADVQAFKAGDEIYGYSSLLRCGAYAEFIVVKETEITAKPNNVDFLHAAAIPVGALTAWQAFALAGLSAGQTVLIHAAAGGVGSMAVQVAKVRGAHVIGTASARNAEFVKSLGADEVIDYTTTKFEDVVKDADVVLDLIGSETQARSFGVLKVGGWLVSAVSPPSPEEAEKYGVKSAMITVQPNAAELKEMTALVEAGKLKTFVETVLPLSEARQAQDLGQSGRTRGKIVLQVVM